MITEKEMNGMGQSMGSRVKGVNDLLSLPSGPVDAHNDNEHSPPPPVPLVAPPCDDGVVDVVAAVGDLISVVGAGTVFPSLILI